ncbi:hypothetical protein CYY_005781 [Polysphondylium violaceum]|uniref:S-adenosyl-L-methionine-dependent methyltransferase n=1 Tax=Polysphondylium violaceum TaxID=133409 RepID=A0A8J4PVT9_9MYCE|nr:hypothetical protein CYY_005781 [Polysphondylium violaceum]
MDTSKNYSILNCIGRTAFIGASTRCLLTNGFTGAVLKGSNRKDKELVYNYTSTYESLPISVKVHNNLYIYDPYAFFFTNTLESKQIIEDGIKVIQEKFPDLLDNCYFDVFLKRSCKPKGVIGKTLSQLIESNPNLFMKTSSLRVMQFFNNAFKKSKNIPTMEEVKLLIGKCDALTAWGLLTIDDISKRMAIKTRFIDNFVIENYPIKQIVILGSGFDCRAHRLPLSENHKVFEIDLPQVLDYKEKVLEEALRIVPTMSKSKNSLIKMDLRNFDLWKEELVNSGFNPSQPTIWLMEGLLNYFTQYEIHNILESCGELSVSGSKVMMLTMTATKHTQSDHLKQILTCSLLDQYQSYIDDPDFYMKEAGFTENIQMYSESNLLKKLAHQKDSNLEKWNLYSYTIGTMK